MKRIVESRSRRRMRRIIGGVRVIFACLLLFAFFACSNTSGPSLPEVKAVKDLQPKDLNAHAVRSIRQVTIHSLAVMPMIGTLPVSAEPLAPGGQDSVTAAIYEQVMGKGWKIIPQNQVMQAVQQVPRGTSLDPSALRVGQAVGADGVLYGTVERYQERVGVGYAADKPASVAFTLNLLDMKSGQVVWTGKFARTQQPLESNLFNLPNFIENKGQWIRASQIANEGAEEAITNLRTSLGLPEGAPVQASTPPPPIQ